MIEIAPGLSLADDELRFVASRSGGPGGQNVNKVSTKVTLLFDVASSPSLGERLRRRFLEKLAGRIGRDGVLRVTSQRFRTQSANRQAAVERFVELLRLALVEEAPRVPTRVPKAAKERRVAAKKLRSRLKRERGQPDIDPD
ncbi:MAG: alternative ribosome rescue aminoacyl-tRNA hydrolase ArfB [Acidobacteriota bacterium]